MSDEETLQKHHEESGSEESDDDVEDVPRINIDPSTLTPLSPEVISKQVRSFLCFFLKRSELNGAHDCRQRSTWVRGLGMEFE